MLSSLYKCMYYFISYFRNSSLFVQTKEGLHTVADDIHGCCMRGHHAVTRRPDSTAQHCGIPLGSSEVAVQKERYLKNSSVVL